MQFYVYEWFVVATGEVFYVGKGCGNRYKSTLKRNKWFKDYVKAFECEARIIKSFESEEEAFAFEHKRIMELKASNLAKANLDYGGKGGSHFVWTDEMKQYKSEYNPMKSFEQRQRMKENNPMRNKQTQEIVFNKTRKKVVLNGVVYNGVLEASRVSKHTSSSIIKWCKRGYDDNGKPCRYYNEPQKEIPLVRQLHPKSTTTKAVIVDGIRFETVKDGAKYIGGNSRNLIMAIKAHRTYLGHTCSYA